MEIALTTRWNASSHTDGEAMITEILEMGFEAVELGYDTRLDLVPGVRKMVEQKAVRVNSLHNFCPLPVTAPRGHPEVYTFANEDPYVRENAVRHTINTIEFAAEVGARVIVTHCGYVETRVRTQQLVSMVQHGQRFSADYDRQKMRLQMERDKMADRHLQWLAEALEQLLPTLETHRVQLAMENLPTWEAMPSEIEIERIMRHFNSPWIRYWHDTGHGQIRDNLGFINSERWLQRLEPYLAGMHIHDVAHLIADHTMPPKGDMDFTWLTPIVQKDIVRVIEPSTRTDKEEIVEALAFLKNLWDTPAHE